MHGVSVFDAIAVARAQNDVFAERRFRSPFRYIATLTITMDAAIECDDSFGNQHHWDLYGTATELLACVTAPDIEL